jgi:KipI family sensor histidine kinase inhibitor
MIRFQYASDQSLMVYLGDAIDVPTHRRVLKLLRLLVSDAIPHVINIHPAYCSILIVFDPAHQEHAQLEALLNQRVSQVDSVDLAEPRTVEIPVRYGGDDGPDLIELASLRGLTPERVIELHTSATYLVYFMGFVPGFAYLGGLPEELATPRLESPRKKVPKGSVAIGGAQTGIYPFETPGGWRLIGRTPLDIFDPDSAELSCLRLGDLVRFSPIA